ncbi:hypothetical protein ABMA27_014732 [Loxostege sticticalis]|uniref:Uncharacterized protein n=1 Tax=Loxostege sticticalis TaxID=481309 RepID=A0ABR3IA16_LOXSC
MANCFVQTCCLIVLTIFVERGDGRWKKKDGNLQHDIELFRRMADKIEHELEDTYDDYTSRRWREQIFDSLHEKYGKYSARKAKNDTKYELKSKEAYVSSMHYKNILNNDPVQMYISQMKLSGDMKSDANIHSSKLEKLKTLRWPKFEDILLEVGKKYDWKNDRWIKVRRKLKGKDVENISDNNSEDFHEKHKFHYKMVKLNKSKNRRNVVVAVSAVR